MNIRFAAIAASATVAILPTAAFAEWKVAETDNFIYYSEAPADEMVVAVTQLETFDRLVRALTGNTRPPSPVKVELFEVNTMVDVNETFPYPSRGVGGYYSTTTSGPFLVTFRKAVKSDTRSARRTSVYSYDWGPEVRQHEYLHGYMYQYFNANYPSWYSEGFAEYYGTVAFPEEGVVEIGHAPYFRMNTIRESSWLHVSKLLTAKSYDDVDDIGMLYAEGWLLTHLGAQNRERGQQLQKYLQEVAQGTPYAKAATDAFGDLDQLNRDLKAHAKDLQAMRLSLKPMDLGKIEVRKLPAVEDALMRYKIRLNSGFSYDQLPMVVRTARQHLATDPTNPNALHIVAQLENLADMHADALKTADRLLALEPQHAGALTEKGKAMVGLLKSDAPAAQWDAAREPLETAATVDKLAIEPRVELFKSFGAQGQLASIAAQNRLVEAFQLLPQNDDIRYLLARDFEQRGLIDDAIAIIEPAAFGSFDGDEGTKRRRERYRREAAERFTSIVVYEDAREMLDRLEAKKEGRWDEATQTARAETDAAT